MPLPDTERAAILADLAAIKARANAATEGPWESMSGVVVANVPTETVIAHTTHVYGLAARKERWGNTDFMATARSDVPRLIGYVERLLADDGEEE